MKHIALLASLILVSAAHAQSPSPSSAPATGPSIQAILDVLSIDRDAHFAVPQGEDAYVPRPPEQRRELEAIYGRLATGSLADTDTTIKEFTKKHGKLRGLPDGQDGLQGMRKFREFSSPRASVRSSPSSVRWCA